MYLDIIQEAFMATTTVFRILHIQNM